MYGLGLAPAIATGLVTLGTKILASILTPNEVQQLQAAIGQGNVVAWWRLKAMDEAYHVRMGLEASPGYVRFLQDFPGALLTSAEKEALQTALGGPVALTISDDAVVYAGNAIFNDMVGYYTSGVGLQMDQKARAVLAAPSGDSVLAGFSMSPVLLLGAVATVVLTMRKGH